jgi:sugar lactone lactonase YvrE
MRSLIALTGVALLVSASLAAAPKKSRVAPPPPAPALSLVHPNGLALDADGNLFISDIETHRVLKLDRQGVLRCVAGTGAGGFSGDGFPGVKARLNAPHDLALDAGGNLLIADTYNHRIRRLDRQGVITTIAGNGSGKYAGDNGSAAKASLNNPQGIAVGGDGSLYIADTYNHVVRRVDPQGVMTTFAGTEAGLAGDGVPANRAQLSLPMAVAVSPEGAVYISDAGNNRIRRVTREGVMETVLGTGPGSGTAGAGFGGDGGPVEKARIFAATDLEFNPAGDLFVSDSGNNRVRLISKGMITTLAGSGAAGFGGDGGSALSAVLNTPQKIALGRDGALYIADRANHQVRRVDAGGRIESVRTQVQPIAAPAGRQVQRRAGEAR